MVDKLTPASLAALELAGYQPEQLKQAAKPLAQLMRDNGWVGLAIANTLTPGERHPATHPLIELMERYGIAAISLTLEEDGSCTANVHLKGPQA